MTLLSFLSWQTNDLKWADFKSLVTHPEFLPTYSPSELRAFILHTSRNVNLCEFIRASSWIDQSLRWQERAWREKIEVVFPGHPDYPLSFLGLEEPPLAISYRGHPCWRVLPCLAVVGSREPLAESLEWMDCELGQVLETSTIATVSGGARGIDQKCHSLSLRHQCPTVIAVPSGLTRLYPRDLRHWVEPVIESGGAILSPFALDSEMRKHRFRSRNLLIAQMAHLVLIVECARRSGTYMTARMALEKGIPLGVVPGHPLQPKFQGALDLISDGPLLVRDAVDIKVSLGRNLGPSFAQTPNGGH